MHDVVLGRDLSAPFAPIGRYITRFVVRHGSATTQSSIASKNAVALDDAADFIHRPNGTHRRLIRIPESLHHPKEEEYVFAKLRALAPESGALLATLEAQHQLEPGLISAIENALDRYQ